MPVTGETSCVCMAFCVLISDKLEHFKCYSIGYAPIWWVIIEEILSSFVTICTDKVRLSACNRETLSSLS
eukprot:Awhi_evm2s3046